jgi:hypothetical protein
MKLNATTRLSAAADPTKLTIGKLEEIYSRDQDVDVEFLYRKFKRKDAKKAYYLVVSFYEEDREYIVNEMWVSLDLSDSDISSTPEYSSVHKSVALAYAKEN